MKNQTILATAVAATVGGLPAAAQATTYTATLTEVRYYANGAPAGVPRNISSSTATWSYDDVSNLVSQTGGLFNVRTTTAPTSTIFRQSITGLVMGNGGAASATSYVCAEGNFGPGVGASICGNYNFGANFFNESTTSWGPGTAVSRTLGGDDGAVGAQNSVATLNAMTTITWTGTTLVLRNATCTGICTTNVGAFNNGEQWTFATAPVPLPAAVWLFGSALGVMGAMRRKHQSAMPDTHQTNPGQCA